MSELLDYYAKRAAEYDRIYEKPERQRDLAYLRERVPQLLAGRDVLEVACGTGYWSECIAATARSLLCTDATSEVLEIARARLGDRAAFAIADAYALEELDGTFDGFFAGFFWSHVPLARLRPFIAQVNQRLAREARVLFLDNRYVEGSSTAISETDGGGNTYQSRRLSDGTRHRVLKNFPSRAQLKHFLDGVRNLEIEETEYYWLASYEVG